MTMPLAKYKTLNGDEINRQELANHARVPDSSKLHHGKTINKIKSMMICQSPF
jgi:hypothetical protein